MAEKTGWPALKDPRIGPVKYLGGLFPMSKTLLEILR
jgi:hypothetical protein